MQTASPRKKKAASPRKNLFINQGANFSRALRAVKVATFSARTSAITKPFIKQFFISKNLFILKHYFIQNKLKWDSTSQD
jgi:hypothetical protein